ncbi:hypothetical protein A2U01_0063894, partial [Trifolium medium]|nr:hypothetical protein [Trifolium medium]
MVEEGGWSTGFEEVFVDDQLHRSEVGSSCASGGKGVARAELDELDGVDTDSDASGGCQRVVPFGVQVACGSTGFKQQEGSGVEKPV